MPLAALLRCNDLELTGEHYRDALGFAVSETAEGPSACASRTVISLHHARPVGRFDSLLGQKERIPTLYWHLMGQIGPSALHRKLPLSESIAAPERSVAAAF